MEVTVIIVIVMIIIIIKIYFTDEITLHAAQTANTEELQTCIYRIV
jgi:hypothetical protein